MEQSHLQQGSGQLASFCHAAEKRSQGLGTHGASPCAQLGAARAACGQDRALWGGGCRAPCSPSSCGCRQGL